MAVFCDCCKLQGSVSTPAIAMQGMGAQQDRSCVLPAREKARPSFGGLLNDFLVRLGVVSCCPFCGGGCRGGGGGDCEGGSGGGSL